VDADGVIVTSSSKRISDIATLPKVLGNLKQATINGLKGVGHWTLDMLLPPVCLKCNIGVAWQGDLCADCWSDVSFLNPPWCECCGRPFEFDEGGGGDGVYCGDCARRRPLFDRARAAMIYDDASRDLILRFKHADQTQGAPSYARWMQRVGSELLAEADIVGVVPLHRWRLLKRRYNQAGLLAREMTRERDCDFLPALLQRVKSTPSQSGNKANRVRNVRRAFALRSKYQDQVRDKRILLVDDVMTTGATVEACARVLLNAGATGIDVVTMARVVRAEV
jgi:ComF family protein